MGTLYNESQKMGEGRPNKRREEMCDSKAHGNGTRGRTACPNHVVLTFSSKETALGLSSL